MTTTENATIAWCDNRVSTLLEVFGHGHYRLLLPIPIRTSELVWRSCDRILSVEMRLYHRSVLRHHHVIGALCGVRLAPIGGLEADSIGIRINAKDGEPEEPMGVRLSALPMDASDKQRPIGYWIREGEHLQKIERLQKVEIKIDGTGDPSRVARLVKDKLEKMAREPTRSPCVPNLKARSAPVNDHVCATRGNDRCSKSEMVCWRCGARI